MRRAKKRLAGSSVVFLLDSGSFSFLKPVLFKFCTLISFFNYSSNFLAVRMFFLTSGRTCIVLFNPYFMKTISSEMERSFGIDYLHSFFIRTRAQDFAKTFLKSSFSGIQLHTILESNLRKNEPKVSAKV